MEFTYQTEAGHHPQDALARNRIGTQDAHLNCPWFLLDFLYTLTPLTNVLYFRDYISVVMLVQGSKLTWELCFLAAFPWFAYGLPV